MSQTTESKNKKLVLDAFDTLFNKRDYAAAENFWSPDYIQHSAHIPPGRDGLFNLVRSIPPTLKYEPGEIVADNDLVIENKLKYCSMAGTGTHTFATPVVQLDNTFVFAHMFIFDPVGKYGDFIPDLEYHEEPAIRMVQSYLWAPERGQPNGSPTATRRAGAFLP